MKMKIVLDNMTTQNVTLATDLVGPDVKVSGPPGVGKTTVMNAIRKGLGYVPVAPDGKPMSDAGEKAWMAGGTSKVSFTQHPKTIILGPNAPRNGKDPAIDFSGPKTTVRTFILWCRHIGLLDLEEKVVHRAFSTPDRARKQRMEALKTAYQFSSANPSIARELAQLTQEHDSEVARIKEAKAKVQAVWEAGLWANEVGPRVHYYASQFEDIIPLAVTEMKLSGLRLELMEDEETKTLSTSTGAARGVFQVVCFLALMDLVQGRDPTSSYLLLLDDEELAGLNNRFRETFIGLVMSVSDGATPNTIRGSVVWTEQRGDELAVL